MLIKNGVLVYITVNDLIDGKFEVPEEVTSIGEGAFRGCRGLRELNIPIGVTSIGKGAFNGCLDLRELNIPEGVTSIEPYTFGGCISLGELNIPEGVTSIGDYAFSGCRVLRELNIPEGITSIGEHAFSGCSALTKLNIPEGVTSIEPYTFNGCNNLRELDIPVGVTSIGDGAFSGCSALTKLNIPEGVTNIGEHAFSGCNNLRELNIPEGITSIEPYTFNGCNNLRELSIPVGVTNIEPYTFNGCNNLGELNLPKGLTNIGKNAFWGCKILKELNLPASVTSIRRGAFNVCNNLKIIRLEKLESFFDEHKVGEKTKKDARLFASEYLINSNNDIGPDQLDMLINKLVLWSEKDFIPMKSLLKKIPEDRIRAFDRKVWFKLAREPVFNISEETKMALAELAYTFGVFDKDICEIRGIGKNIDEVAEGDKRSGNAEDYQKRLKSILDMVHSGRLTNVNLHTMFDGTDMKFKPAFYRFFMDNQEEIFSDSELMESIPKIQRDMDKIMLKFGGYVPTIQECKRYFSEIIYEGIEGGNQGLAELCKLCGVTQENFEAYQRIYNEQKKRKESSIPGLSGSNYRILNLDDPRTLLIGEGRFSKCCQRLEGAGQECMEHSAKSQNGRIIEIIDDDGTLIAQSWMWRNGNVVCFDSIEANAIEDKKYSDADRKRLIDKIESAYREAGKALISESEDKVEAYRKRKQQEIARMEVPESEKKKMLEELDRICDDSKIKMVTVGKGYWPISLKITERFSNKEVDSSNGRVSPRERIDYLNDSDIQYIVAEAEDIGILRTDDAKVEVMYRDKRRIKKEEGENISEDTIEKIKQIEQEAHKKGMQLMGDTISAIDLTRIYGTSLENLKVIYGEDWYYVYSNEANEIHIHDLARGSSRFEDEKQVGSIEMGKGFDEIVLESMRKNKPIGAELREDTSYILVLEMIERGLLKQVGDDVAFEFSGGISYDENEDVSTLDERVITQEEQKNILARKKEIRKLGPTEKNTTMHRLQFEPTERYKKILKEREAKKARNNDDKEYGH